MNHKNEKEMMFHFLGRINYNQPWEKIQRDMGYDFGDYFFVGKDTREIIKRLARQIHIELENTFNNDGSPCYLSEHMIELINEGKATDPRR